MKYLLSITIFLSSHVFIYSQWIAQNSNVNVNLYDIEFFDANIGWAVGDNGTVIKTTNGGANWIFMANPTHGSGKVLNNLSVVDANTMYFVGGHATLIKTTNGGQSWIEIRNGPFGSGNGFAGIHMLNASTGWVCGGNNTLRTFNSFQNYDSSYLNQVSLYDIYFKDLSNGLIPSFGKVYKTTNGGTNWFDSNVPTGSAVPNFYKIAVAENQYAWVVGGGKVYRTTNFGDSWVGTDTIPNISIQGIFFINKNTGYAGGGRNQVFKSTDGGYNWIREKTDTTTLAFISSIWFADNMTGWYTGGIGKIYHTTTGGEPLTSITVNSSILPIRYSLSQNYPNPFNPSTKIKFAIPKSSFVKLTVYDILGREAAKLVNGNLSAGSYEYEFDGTGLNSGVYFYRLEAGEHRETRRMVLLK